MLTALVYQTTNHRNHSADAPWTLWPCFWCQKTSHRFSHPCSRSVHLQLGEHGSPNSTAPTTVSWPCAQWPLRETAIKNASCWILVALYAFSGIFTAMALPVCYHPDLCQEWLLYHPLRILTVKSCCLDNLDKNGVVLFQRWSVYRLWQKGNQLTWMTRMRMR